MVAIGKVLVFNLLYLKSPIHLGLHYLPSFNPGRISLNPVISLATKYGKTTHCPLPTIEVNSSHKRGMCTIINLCGPLSRVALCCPSVHRCLNNPPPPPCTSTTLGGVGTGGPSPPGLKSLPGLSSI